MASLTRNLLRLTTIRRAYKSGYNLNRHYLLRHPISLGVTGVLSKHQFSTSDEFGDIQDVDPMTLDATRNGKGDDLKYLIIDVREESELQMDGNLGEDKTDWIHIPLAVIQNISDKEELTELLEKKGIEDLEEFQDFYFLCKVGIRSMKAANHVLELDVDQTLFNISGGILRYRNDVGL